MEIVKFNPDRPSPEDISRFYEEGKMGIDRRFDSSANPTFEGDFVGLTSREMEDLKIQELSELSLKAAFFLLTYIESLFRTDFILRLETGRKGKDQLTKEYKRIYKQGTKIYSYSLKDVIFANWKVYVSNKSKSKELTDILNVLPQYFDFRNWMAHGRYWRFKESNYALIYNYESVRLLLLNIETYFSPLLKKKNFGMEEG